MSLVSQTTDTVSTATSFTTTVGFKTIFTKSITASNAANKFLITATVPMHVTKTSTSQAMYGSFLEIKIDGTRYACTHEYWNGTTATTLTPEEGGSFTLQTLYSPGDTSAHTVNINAYLNGSAQVITICKDSSSQAILQIRELS